MSIPLKKSLLPDVTTGTLGGIAAIPAVAGLALASGLPLRSAVVGVLVGTGLVSVICRHRFQFHAPATSLILSAMLAYKAGGPLGLALTVIAAGLIQILAGIAQVGWWVHILPPKVVGGLMSGIGALVVYKQFDVLFANAPDLRATLIGVAIVSGTVAITAGWPRLAQATERTWLRRVPGAAVALVVAAAFWWCLHDDAPPLIDTNLQWFMLPSLWQEGVANFSMNWELLALAGSIALLSGSKALVVTAGLHRQDKDHKVNFNRELIVVGIGNVTSGLLFGLPLTAHLDRSQFTRDSGGRTRLATALQGFVVAIVLTFVPGLFNAVPIAAFVGILVHSGSKLVDWGALKSFVRRRKEEEQWLFIGTFATTVFFNLTAGVLAGLLLGMVRLATKFAATAEIRVARAADRNDLVVLFLKGAFTFVCLRRLAEAVRDIDPSAIIVLDAKEVYYIDHACLSFFEELRANQQVAGGEVIFDRAALSNRTAQPLNLRTEVLKELKGIDRRKAHRGESVGRRRIDQILAEVEAVESQHQPAGATTSPKKIKDAG